MKAFISIGIIFVSSLTTLAQKDYIRLISLPDSLKKLITLEYGDWDFFNSAVPYFDSTGKYIAWEYADIIKGDFDNNGEIDYSLLIHLKNSEKGYLIILFNNGDKYKLLELSEIPYPNDCTLYTNKKGTKDFNYEIDEGFILPIDGIEIGNEKAASTFYFDGNKFVRYTSAD